MYIALSWVALFGRFLIIAFKWQHPNVYFIYFTAAGGSSDNVPEKRAMFDGELC